MDGDICLKEFFLPLQWVWHIGYRSKDKLSFLARQKLTLPLLLHRPMVHNQKRKRNVHSWTNMLKQSKLLNWEFINISLTTPHFHIRN